MRRFVVLVVSVAVVLLSIGAAGPANATPGSPPGAVRAAADETVRVAAPVFYQRETWSFNNGANMGCYAVGLVYFGDLQGYQPAFVEGVTTAPGYPSYPYKKALTAPYDDAQTFNGNPLNRPGQHKYALAEFYAFSSPPFRDCTPEAAEQQATYGTSVTIIYERSQACLDAQTKVEEAKAKVKSAKKTLNRATTDADKRKARKKLKKAKKKLKKAEAQVAQSC